jgi:hypothetical protein
VIVTLQRHPSRKLPMPMQPLNSHPKHKNNAGKNR